MAPTDGGSGGADWESAARCQLGYEFRTVSDSVHTESDRICQALHGGDPVPQDAVRALNEQYIRLGEVLRDLGHVTPDYDGPPPRVDQLDEDDLRDILSAVGTHGDH